MRKPNNWTSVQIRFKGIALYVSGYTNGGDFEVDEVDFVYPKVNKLVELLEEITEWPMNEIATLAAEAHAECLQGLGEDDNYEAIKLNEQ